VEIFVATGSRLAAEVMPLAIKCSTQGSRFGMAAMGMELARHQGFRLLKFQ